MISAAADFCGWTRIKFTEPSARLTVRHACSYRCEIASSWEHAMTKLALLVILAVAAPVMIAGMVMSVPAFAEATPNGDGR